MVHLLSCYENNDYGNFTLKQFDPTILAFKLTPPLPCFNGLYKNEKL